MHENVDVGLCAAASSAVQQAAAVRTHSDLHVGEYSDPQEATTWSRQCWSREIADNQVFLFCSVGENQLRGFMCLLIITLLFLQVLVMTCHVFLHVLTNHILPLSKINLVVFDDCHLAITEHPYCEVMKVKLRFLSPHHPTAPTLG